jgi:hypothetical protein
MTRQRPLVWEQLESRHLRAALELPWPSRISFLPPDVQVFNQNHDLPGEAQTTSELGDILTVQLPGVELLRHDYSEVRSPDDDVFGVGRYALSVTFDGLSLVNPSSPPSILPGPYDSLSAGGMAGVLADSSSVLFQSGLDLNRTSLTAEPLSNEPGFPTDSHHAVVASLGDANAVGFYRIQVPRTTGGQPGVLTVSLAQMPVNGVLPAVSVYNANANPVSSEILLNGNGKHVIQATNVTPGATYYLRVSAAPAPSPAIGSYSLVGSFGTVPVAVQTLASGRLSATGVDAQYNLSVATTRLFQFVLSSSSEATASNAQVCAEIYNRSGVLVLGLVGGLGETVGDGNMLLTPGAYRVRITLVGASGSKVPAIANRITGGRLTDAIGPTTADPVEEPMYPCPGNPAVDCYCYPDGVYSTVPYETSASSS